MEDEAENSKNSRPRRIKNVDPEKVRKKLLTVLDRDVAILMDESAKGKLSNEQSRKLTKYLKLLDDLGPKIPGIPPENLEPEPNDHEDLSDQKLIEMAKAKTMEGQNE